MNPYTPKFSHILVSTALAIVLIWGSAYVDGRGGWALLIGASVLLLIAGGTLLNMVMTVYNERWDKIESFANTYTKLDDEARAVLGFTFPTLRYKMRRGAVREMFEDTNVTAEQFRLFLKTSNDKYISPERDWQSKEFPPAVWSEIYHYLCDHGYVFPNSASGNISHQWKGESYRHLMAYWMPIGHGTKDRGESVAYAYEEEL
jgi:hypothetical protein